MRVGAHHQHAWPDVAALDAHDVHDPLEEVELADPLGHPPFASNALDRGLRIVAGGHEVVADHADLLRDPDLSAQPFKSRPHAPRAACITDQGQIDCYPTHSPR